MVAWLARLLSYTTLVSTAGLTVEDILRSGESVSCWQVIGFIGLTDGSVITVAGAQACIARHV